MLYLLGGPPRAGKTKIAERFSSERGVGWLSLDVVRSVARSLNTELAGIDMNVGGDPAVLARAMYPTFELVCRMASSLAEEYLIEGVDFMPSQVTRLPHSIPRRAVFVGMSTVTLEDINVHVGRNDWHMGLSDEEVSRLPAWIVSWSELVQRECDDQGMPYVDLAADWEAGVAQVVREMSAR